MEAGITLSVTRGRAQMPHQAAQTDPPTQDLFPIGGILKSPSTPGTF